MLCGRLQERSAAPSPRRNRLAASKRTGERRNGLYKGETVCRRDKRTVDGKSVLILEFYGRMEEEEEEEEEEGRESLRGALVRMREESMVQAGVERRESCNSDGDGKGERKGEGEGEEVGGGGGGGEEEEEMGKGAMEGGGRKGKRGEGGGCDAKSGDADDDG